MITNTVRLVKGYNKAHLCKNQRLNDKKYDVLIY